MKEVKTSNSVPTPPPLLELPPPLKPLRPQPATMSLLSTSKSGNSSDSIKITENPDSAVITPIPNNDDAEKSKKSTTNVVRSPEKRLKKQSFASLLKSNYTLDSLDSEYEKEKKVDKESDDDITLIKVVNNEDKKLKQLIRSDEIKFEILKKPVSTEVEFTEKANVKKSTEDTKAKSSNDSSLDASSILNWKDGVGILPESTLKVQYYF